MKPLALSFLFSLSPLLYDAFPGAHAVRFPIRGRVGGFGGPMTKRATITGKPDLTNEGNLQYQTNITLNGQQFEVLVDTGR